MAVLFALLSAFSQALGSVLQRQAAMKTSEAHAPDHVATEPAPSFRWWSSIWHLIRQPRWLLGLGAMAGTLIFNATALYFGQLATVQPILVTELLFVLALRAFWLRDPVGGRTWLSAGVLCFGLVSFLVFARPTEGTATPDARAWLVAIVPRALLIGALVVASRWGSPGRRAALLGVAVGMIWAIDAAFIKQTTNVLSHSGWSGVLVHWPLYAAVASGVLGTVLLEVALAAGPLVSSQSALMIVDPLASIILGVEIFGEQLRHSPAAITAQVLSLLVMCVGVLTLARRVDAPGTPANGLAPVAGGTRRPQL